jgi:hypothetical protein
MTKITLSDQFSKELAAWGKSATVECLKTPEIKPSFPSLESWNAAGNIIKGIKT